MIETRPMCHSSLANVSPVEVLQLIRSENVGPRTFFSLLDFYGSVEKVIAAMPNLAKKGGKRAPKLCAREVAEQEYNALIAAGVTVLPYGAAEYPEGLLTVEDASPLLMVRGDAAHWQKPCIGIVGARNASANGCQFARNLAHGLGEAGYCVTSGLARGVDKFAHEGALSYGTVGVIAGGIDTVYPPEHRGLYSQMFDQGAVITEVPFGASPQARNFPARNRIIAGMSKAVIVIEAARRSGTLITARMALEYNREVLAVPGSPLDPRCEGTNDLIKQGAGVVTSVEDVIEALAQPRPFTLSEPANDRFAHQTLMDEFGDIFDETSDEETAIPENIEALLLEKLSPSPILLDELAAQCHILPHHMQAALLSLELSGQVERHPGGRVSLSMEQSAV